MRRIISRRPENIVTTRCCSRRAEFPLPVLYHFELHLPSFFHPSSCLAPSRFRPRRRRKIHISSSAMQPSPGKPSPRSVHEFQPPHPTYTVLHRFSRGCSGRLDAFTTYTNKGYRVLRYSSVLSTLTRFSRTIGSTENEGV